MPLLASFGPRRFDIHAKSAVHAVMQIRAIASPQFPLYTGIKERPLHPIVADRKASFGAVNLS
jgi:hypothetical protein